MQLAHRFLLVLPNKNNNCPGDGVDDIVASRGGCSFGIGMMDPSVVATKRQMLFPAGSAGVGGGEGPKDGMTKTETMRRAVEPNECVQFGEPSTSNSLGLLRDAKIGCLNSHNQQAEQWFEPMNSKVLNFKYKIPQNHLAASASVACLPPPGSVLSAFL